MYVSFTKEHRKNRFEKRVAPNAVSSFYDFILKLVKLVVDHMHTALKNSCSSNTVPYFFTLHSFRVKSSFVEPYLFCTVPVPTFEKLWFRFRLLKKLWFRFPVPVPTFEKLRFRFRFQLYIKTIKANFARKILDFFPFLHSKVFYKEKVYNFQQIYCKM